MLLSKLWAAMLVATGLAILAAAAGIGLAVALLSARAVSTALPAGTLAKIVVGGLAAATVSSALGTGVGAIARSPTAGIAFALATLLLAAQGARNVPVVLRVLPADAQERPSERDASHRGGSRTTRAARAAYRRRTD